MQSSVTDQQLTQRFTVFEIDNDSSEYIDFGCAKTNQGNSLEIFIVKLKFPFQTSLSHEINTNMIISIGARTYLNDQDLPRKLFLMKSISKMYEYFADQKSKTIKLEQKVKKGQKKLIMKVKVPVSKNIVDFVELELSFIEQESLPSFVQANRKILTDIFEKIHQLTISAEIKQDLKKQKEGVSNEANQLKDKQMTEFIVEEGQMSTIQNDLSCKRKGSPNYSEQISCLQETAVNYEFNHINVDKQSDFEKQDVYSKEFQARQNQKLSQQFSEEEGTTNESYEDDLKNQQIALLEQRNQILMDRLIALQLQIVKKNIRLETYEDQKLRLKDSNLQTTQIKTNVNPCVDKKAVKNLFSTIQSKYQSRIKQYIRQVNQFKIRFQILKNLIESSQNEKRRHKKNTNTEKKTFSRKYNYQIELRNNELKQISQIDTSINTQKTFTNGRHMKKNIIQCFDKNNNLKQVLNQMQDLCNQIS